MPININTREVVTAHQCVHVGNLSYDIRFGAVMILVTDSSPFGIFNLSVFFVSLPFGLAFIVASVFLLR